MPSPFTIIQGKEGASPKRPLFLVTITAPDGDVCYLTTAASYGTPNIAYNGNTYLARIQKNELQAIQAMGPQGYDSIPGFTITLADADKSLWTSHCVPHGWRGSTITLTALLWDVVANQYSTDAIQWTFIGGNPQHNHAQGQTTLDVTSATNFTRLKVPSVPIEYRCPWDFPSTAAQRASALNDPTSPYYQCGYSPDITGGCGNFQTGSTPYTSCDCTRSGGAGVGCVARMGNASRTMVAPDGDLTQDTSGRATARFGGVTWLAPTQYGGRQYVTGQKTFGFNQPNTAIAGSYYNWVYGTQWVQGQVLAPAGDPNSLRSEVALCFAPFGPVTVQQLLVNGVLVPQNGSDKLFTWRYINQGGRQGTLNGDAYYSTSSYSGLGDPHGSVCVIEFVVPFELAAPGSIPTVQALVTSGPLMNCYPIASASGSGGEISITFAAGVPDLNIGPGAKIFIGGNSWSAANGAFTVDTATYGPPGVLTLLGTAATGSGTGGGVFFTHPPDLSDSGYDIATQDSVGNAAAANPVWACLDLMMWGNILSASIDAASWYAASLIAATPISYVGADGNSYTHAQFKTCLQLPGGSRQALSAVLTGLRNSANLMIGPNNSTGLIQCFIKQTLADQQPAAVSGSNDTTARASVTAAGAAANGFYGYLFNETNIEKGSFKITTTRIEATPNTVSFPFQDEYNSYQQDSLTEIDPNAYAYSGNQEVSVPIQLLGIPNFDQGTRIANVQMAEALYGNPRNDPGGTLYFEFTVNQRVMHLAGRLGYICGLTWQELGIGVSAPQAVRILSLKPDTDGEHWAVKCAWHNDNWYTYTYGQNPTPYQKNPLLGPQLRPPYPWRPGVATWGSSDAMFPGKDSFAFSVDTTQYPAQLAISGNVPVNAQPTGLPPSVPLQASTGSTGGTIPPGTYHIAFSVNGVIGPVSGFVTVIVPAGTNTNTITVSGIQWKNGAAPAIQPFIGRHSMAMVTAASASYSGSSPDSNGNPTSYTFTAITPDGLGLPDINFSEFLVEETGIVHGGVWGDTITSVDGTGKVLSFPEASWTSGQWNGYVLSLYYRPATAYNPTAVYAQGAMSTYGGTTYTSLVNANSGNRPDINPTQWVASASQPALNMAVSSSTATTFTMPSTGFQAGDVVVLRAKSAHITASTIGDDNFINSYAPTGLDINGEVGNLIQIISGTGAWQTPKSVASNTETVFTINGTWDILPDATSVFIVLEPTVAYSYYTQAFTGTGAGVSSIANTPAITTEEQSLLVTVFACDANGNASPMQYQPSREVYIPPQSILSTALVLNVQGTLAIGSDLAPLFYPLNAINPAAVVARVKLPPTGADLTLQIYSGTTLWMSLDIPAGTNNVRATNGALNAAGPLPAAQDVILNIAGVGTTFPGSDLSVMIFT